jgi:hypothetical protein
VKCAICDKTLSEQEIIMNKQTGTWEPCGLCLEIALDAAFSGDFKADDDLDDPELNSKFGSGAVETLDTDTYRSYYDHCDAGQSSRTSQDEYD